MTNLEHIDRFPLIMIGGPVDGELTTMLRNGRSSPGTSIGVPVEGSDPQRFAWYDRLGTEPIVGRWAFVYRETSGPDRAVRTFADETVSV